MLLAEPRCDALTDYCWSQRRREAVIRAQSDPSEPPAELLAAGVERLWSCRGLLSVQIAKGYRLIYRMRVGTCKKTSEESWLVFTLIVPVVLLPGALRVVPERSTFWCRERRAGSGADPRLASDRFTVSVTHMSLVKYFLIKESAVDCLPIKGIMIFSDMSTGTNSPKVHPPNGTRFYTFQAS